MTTPDAAQPERTMAAWARTALAVETLSVLAIRATDAHPVSLVVFAVVTVVLLALSPQSSRRGLLRRQRMLVERGPVPLAVLAVGSLVVVMAFATAGALLVA